MDNARLERLRELAGLPRQVGLAVQGPQGWQLAAGNLESALRKNTALANGAATLIDDDGNPIRLTPGRTFVELPKADSTLPRG